MMVMCCAVLGCVTGRCGGWLVTGCGMCMCSVCVCVCVKDVVEVCEYVYVSMSQRHEAERREN